MSATEQIVQVADASSPTKNMRTLQQTINSNTVQSEVVVLATGTASGGDSYDARQIRALTSSDVVTAQGQATLTNWIGVQLTSDASHAASVINAAPTTQYGLVTRNIPSGTQTVSGSVSISGTATVAGTVTANMGTANTLTNAWPHTITDNLQNGPAAVMTSGLFNPALNVVIDGGNTPTVAIGGQPTVIMGQNNASVNITASGQTSPLAGTQGRASVNVQANGGGQGGVMHAPSTLVLDYSFDNGTNFFPAPGNPIYNWALGQWQNNITTCGIYSVSMPGCNMFRFRSTTWSVNDNINVNLAVNMNYEDIMPTDSATGASVPLLAKMVAGADPLGTLRALQTDGYGRLQVQDGPGYVQASKAGWGPGWGNFTGW